MNETDNELFWQSPETVSSRLDVLLRENKPFVFLEGPSRIDTDKHREIPVLVAQAAAAKDFDAGSLLAEGWMVVVDQDRNRITMRPVQYSPGAEPVVEDEPGEADLDDPSVGMQELWLDLREKFGADIAEGACRLLVQGVLPKEATKAVAMEVGPGGERFQEALEKARLAAGSRESVPDSLLARIPTWKARSVTADLARGVEILVVESPTGPHLQVAVACEELWGERIHMEPGAVLPNGMRPPDAVRTLHLVLAGSRQLLSCSLEVPAIAGFPDGLLRCRLDIPLQALFPGIAGNSTWGCYAYCGPVSAGPVEVSLPR